VRGFPAGFGYQYDQNLLTEAKVLSALKRQMGKKVTFRQQAAAIHLWELGDKKTDKQERLFAALINDELLSEARLLALEEVIPQELVGVILTVHFFSP